MTNINLFLYDLAVVAIFKDEGHYLKEWLDYHLLAGVEHFYLYNNDSSDDYAEILAPYIEKNLVTLTDLPGKLQMYPAYNDALEKHRFECRYMAFIDLDEFIFPKSNRSIVEVVDEILSQKPNAAGLGINWQCFGSNGQETADYSRGLLERFTRRAPSEWSDLNDTGGNVYRKIISNPRLIRYAVNPHFAVYYDDKSAVNSDGKFIPPAYHSKPILTDKIVINHYYTKSKEEYIRKKIPKGSCCMTDAAYDMANFQKFDRNEVFDDEILSYRAARAENFYLESHEEKIRRVEQSLINILLQCAPTSAPADFFDGKLETFLTCRALAEKFGTKIENILAEECALVWIYMTFIKANEVTRAEVQQFLRALPEILVRPFPICKKINELAQNAVIPSLCESLKNGDIVSGTSDWISRSDLLYIQKLLRLIK